MTTLSFIAFHMRDYQRDTMHLPLEGHGAYFLLLQHCWTHGCIPLDDIARAAICKVTAQRWRKQLAPLVAGYFDEKGENKRATAEIEKAEKMRTRKAMAGHNGGLASQRRRQAIAQATAQATAKLPSSGSLSGSEAIKRDITTNLSGAARAREAEIPDNPTSSAVGVTPQDGSARWARGQTVAPTDDLVTVIAKKGWV